MSIANRIQAINDHLVDDYKVLRLAGADLSGVNKNIVNLKMSWKERLLYFMNNGTDIVWNNWTKVSGTGTTLSLNNTEEAPMSLTYKGNTSQNGTPTPSSPVAVNTVSGNNTITVTNSDNTQSANYPINLGNKELCKIGTYQDKIFKNTPNTTDYDSNLEDNLWYLKKEIGKVVLNGSETWTFNSQSGDSYRYYLNGGRFTENFDNCIVLPENQMNGKTLCSHFSFKPFASSAIGTYTLNNYQNVSWFLLNTNITTLADFKTWLASNNVSVYYVLSTPTYDKITDTTLISQLEAMKQSYDSQTNISQTNNDLPFELNITALSNE